MPSIWLLKNLLLGKELSPFVTCHDALFFSTLNVKSPCGLFRDCSFRDDGRYADTEYQCQWYFTCTYGIFYGHSKCAQGKMFASFVRTIITLQVQHGIKFLIA